MSLTPTQTRALSAGAEALRMLAAGKGREIADDLDLDDGALAECAAALQALYDAAVADAPQPSGDAPVGGDDASVPLVRYARVFSGENERRYGRPWVSKVVRWPVGSHPVVEWGRFLGTVSDGGEVEIMARPGDILHYGQKDNRGGNTLSVWCVADEKGLMVVVTQAQARAAYKGPS